MLDARLKIMIVFFYLIWGKMVSLNRKPRTLPNDIETLFAESKFGSTW